MNMPTEETINSVMSEVSDKVAEALKQTLSEPISQTVTAMVQEVVAGEVARTLSESDFYRKMSGDMESGLRDIYQEIKTARGTSAEALPRIETEKNPDELFEKASDQLDEVLQATETAAVKIIDIVENLQELTGSVSTIVKGFESGGVTKENRIKLKEINDTLSNDLSEIMISLSFQDLTGQRIKIIIESLKSIEDIVREMIVSTGLMIQTKEEKQDLDFEEIEKEVKEKTGELQGPTKDADQGDVDDLLAQFGL